jgi:choline dehydrogenase-like flavoprotein
MSFSLKGTLTDNSNPPVPLSTYTIKVFDKDPIFDVFGDDPIGSAVTLDDGTFRIDFRKEDFKKPGEFWESVLNEPDLYLRVFDPNGNFVHETPVISTQFVPYNNPNEINQCEAIVVGSGFGGTIISLSLVNQFVKGEDPANPDTLKTKVVLLERGQWWVSHELPSSPGSNEFAKKNNPDKGIREYLEANDIPYRTWAYPDNINGLGQFLNTTRIVDRRGLYDYRISSKVHTIAGSGVGGGSLVYTNVTEEPDESVIDSWDSQLNLGINYNNLSKYFDMARGFIGVNKIATTTAIGTNKLPKAKAFQEAAEKIRQNLPPGTIKNPDKKSPFNPADPADPADPDQSPFVEDIYAADLSITDIPYRKDQKTLFKKADTYASILNSVQTNPQVQEKLAILLRKYFGEPNVCERQGRCALGCIPGARHTNNKKIYDYLKDQTKGKHFEIRPLAEVYDIEPLDGAGGSTYKYKIYYTDYGARDWKQASFSWNTGSKSFKLDVRLFRLVDNGRQKNIECKKLFLAAGAIGSTEILLKATNTTRNTGQKLKLSSKLGSGYSTNGDLLGVINPTKTDIYATRGPIVTSAIRFNEGSGFVYTIEDSSVPKMFSGISRLLSQGALFRQLLGFVGLGAVQQVITMITGNPIPIPVSNTTLPVQISDQDLNKVLLLSGMGTDTSDGAIKLQDSWKNNPNRDMNTLNVLDVQFDLNKLVPLFSRMRNSMARIAEHVGENGGSSFSTPLWDPNNINNNSTIVLHNLGGCSMGKDINNGVVDSLGRVYKDGGATLTETYPEFHVIDGGIVPTALGVNSSLTISALAFKIAESIVGFSNLPVEQATVGAKTMYFPR